MKTEKKIRQYAQKIIDLTAAAPEKEPEEPAEQASRRTVNGHSLYADDDGFVRIPAVDAYIATLPEKIRPKLPARFALVSAYRNSVFPSAIAREKCYRNLCARLWSPFMVPAVKSYDAKLYTVTEHTAPAKIDWNVPPENQVHYDWAEGLALQDGNRAYSGDWNPEDDADKMLELVKARAWAEMHPDEQTEVPFG